MIGRGEIRRKAGSYEDALVDFERALSMARPGSVPQAYALTGVGQSKLALGDRSGAREALEAAVALQRKLGSDPADLAETEASLAEARAD